MANTGPLQPTIMPPIPDDSSSALEQRLVTRSGQSSIIHSRETSSVRGRGGLDPSALAPTPPLQPQPQARRGQSHSKSPEAAATSRSAAGLEAGLERKPSNPSYGHHRQASIVHGIQHSRNPSFTASSNTSSPLNPELITTLETHNIIVSTMDVDALMQHQSPRGLAAASGVSAAMQAKADDQDVGDTTSSAPANLSHRRVPSSGRTLRETPHSRTQSKHNLTESKTVGEYALHHLFNSVGPILVFRYQNAS